MVRRSHHTFRPKVLTQGQRFELCAYRALGILPFRRLLFSLERFRHRKDRRTNPNYHMRAISPGGAAALESYLFYHDLIHGISLILLAVILLGKIAYALPWAGMDALAVGMCAVNLWCLMLQRYNRLRLRQLRAQAWQLQVRRLRRRTALFLAALEHSDPALEIDGDLALVQELLTHLSVGEIVYLGPDDIPALRRMAALLDAAGLDRRVKTPAQEVRTASQPVDHLAGELAIQAQPYSRVERRVDRIQRRLLPHRKPLLSSCAIVTVDGQTEAAFSALFRQSSPEGIWETLAVLAAVLERLPEKGA